MHVLSLTEATILAISLFVNLITIDILAKMAKISIL